MLPVNLSMFADLEERVDVRVVREGFADARADLEALIARDRAGHGAAVVRVQAIIDQGLSSGIVDREPVAVLAEIIAEDPDLRD